MSIGSDTEALANMAKLIFFGFPPESFTVNVHFTNTKTEVFSESAVKFST